MQENEEEMMNLILKNCMFKEINGKVIRWILYVEIFYCVNDQKEVDGDSPQGMKWHILCYNNLGIVTNPKTHARKCLIFHYIKTSRIIESIKRLDAKHSIIAKPFDDTNNLVERSLERQLTKKRANVFGPS